MKQIISFDLWNTLIKSNPDHKKAQVQVYIDWFKTTLGIELHKSAIDEIPLILQIENKKYDKLTEYNPTYNFDHSIRLRTIVMQIQTFDRMHKEPNKRIFNVEVPDEKEIEILYKSLLTVFLQFPPISTYPELAEDLTKLSQKYTLIINSNTGVMGNTVMMHVLEKIGIFEQFSAFNFSNVSEYAKPDVRSFNNGKKLPNVHIGDNDYADIIDSKKIVCVVYKFWTKDRLRTVFIDIPNIIKNKRNIINNSSTL